MTAPAPDKEETGVSMPENCIAGTIVRIAVPNRAAIWVRVNEGDQHAVAGRGRDVEQGAECQRRETTLERHAENK